MSVREPNQWNRNRGQQSGSKEAERREQSRKGQKWMREAICELSLQIKRLLELKKILDPRIRN
jgi:hypothetical protein